MFPFNFWHFIIACALSLLACTANASYTLGNGITHSLTQNTRGLPATNTDGNVLQDVYTYGANANVTGIADQIYGKSRGMAYDGQDRLSTTNAPNLWGNGSFMVDVNYPGRWKRVMNC